MHKVHFIRFCIKCSIHTLIRRKIEDKTENAKMLLLKDNRSQ